MFNDREYVESLKRRYAAGTKMVLDWMGDDPRPIER